MAHKIYIGIDNGVTGTVGCVGGTPEIWETPVKNEQNYTKTKKNINRVAEPVLKVLLADMVGKNNPMDCLVLLERPMINNMRFQASISAARSMEATLIAIEELGLPMMYVDSKSWQRKMLPEGCKGTDELKKASKDIGCRLFPGLSDTIMKHEDADGILIAEWARREGL